MMRLEVWILLLTAAMCQTISPEDVEAIEQHLANPPETRTEKSFVKKFTIDMDSDAIIHTFEEILQVRVAGTPEIKEVEKVIILIAEHRYM